jgi:hypothetical protein
MRLLSAYLIGLGFGLGISISGMGNPAKVVNFFDIAGTWDPSLAFVMGGAVLITWAGYALTLRRRAPVLAPRFALPTNRKLDARLIGGSAIFGAGWGISGFCPGGSLPIMGALDADVFIFTAALLIGIFSARMLMQLPSLHAAQRATLARRA